LLRSRIVRLQPYSAGHEKPLGALRRRGIVRGLSDYWALDLHLRDKDLALHVIPQPYARRAQRHGRDDAGASRERLPGLGLLQAMTCEVGEKPSLEARVSLTRRDVAWQSRSVTSAPSGTTGACSAPSSPSECATP